MAGDRKPLIFNVCDGNNMETTTAMRCNQDLCKMPIAPIMIGDNDSDEVSFSVGTNPKMWDPGVTALLIDS